MNRTVKKGQRFPRWASLAMVVFLCLSACGDYGIRLPGNYELVRIYASAVLISHPDDGVVIGAHIDGYKVLDPLVVGHVSLAEHEPERGYSKPGYFILNTKTHEVREALDKAGWLATLQALGIEEEPGLDKPSRFDRNY